MSGSTAPSGYQLPSQAQAGNQFGALLNSNYGYAADLPGQVAPQAQGLAQGIVNNPYAAGQQSGVNTASQIGGSQIAPQAYAGSASLQQYGNAAMGGGQGGYGNQILQQGFDPQQALYARNYQQMQDQTNAINSMYGLGGSPYGAGVANQNANNFNLDWQNQQLGRENTAIQGYGALGTAMGNAYMGASNLGNAGQQTAVNSAQLPYQTYAGNLQNGIGALNQYSGAVSQSMGPGQQQIADLATYLGLGQSGTQIAQQGTQINNAQSNMGWQGLGQLAGIGLSFL